MSRKARELKLDGFTEMKAEITHSNRGKIVYQGLARDPQAIKSIDDAELCWAEEAQTLSERSLEELTPSIRGEDAEIWMTANLQSSNDPFSLRFFKPFERELRKSGWYEDELHTIVWINYYDNPWFPKHLEMERQADKKRMSQAAYDHKWLGEPSDTVADSIILPEWFDAAIDAHIKLGFKPTGAKIVSHDPSDLGEDPKGLVLRHGSVIEDVQDNDHDDVNDGCDWATDYAINNNADLFTWDCDGLGVTLRRQVQQAFNGKKIDYEMFKGSEGVDRPDDIYQHIDGEERGKARTNKETFKNKRAQYTWKLRDRFYNTYRAVVKGEYVDPDELISINSKIPVIDQLRSETCRIPLTPNGSGLIQIMSKEQMLSKHGIKSPNLFDSMFMSMIVPAIIKPKAKHKPIPIMRSAWQR
jgi:phage terminase large subunit